MTDIEQLGQVVIDAARDVTRRNREIYGNPVDDTAHPAEQLLCKAITALDAAEAPDPWEMLRQVREILRMHGEHSVEQAVDDALAWHDKQEASDE